MTGSVEQEISPENKAADEWEFVTVDPPEDDFLFENDVFIEDVTMPSTTQPLGQEESLPVKEGEKGDTFRDWARKTGVAVAGGAMVGVGLIMIPLPTPFGCVVAGAGAAVLGTEFPAVQQAMDKTCNNIANAIEKKIEENEQDDDNEKKEIQEAVHANDTMKTLLFENKQKEKNPFKTTVHQIGRKAAPVIRQIGSGIDKEKLDQASQDVTKNVSMAAAGAKVAITTHATRFWRHVMVLGEDEDVMAPFKTS